MRKETYIVGVSKAYFPLEMRKPMTEFAYLCKVLAVSRPDAARKAWNRFGRAWLSKMLPKETCIRRVSLHVDDPKAGVTGLLGRLNPIEVYSD